LRLMLPSWSKTSVPKASTMRWWAGYPGWTTVVWKGCWVTLQSLQPDSQRTPSDQKQNDGGTLCFEQKQNDEEKVVRERAECTESFRLVMGPGEGGQDF
jgi:hypothetical protein